MIIVANPANQCEIGFERSSLDNACRREIEEWQQD